MRKDIDFRELDLSHASFCKDIPLCCYYKYRFNRLNMKRLTTSYLALLTNADHYGVMRHIVDYLENNMPNNETLSAAFDNMMTAHNTEIDAYAQMRKDYTSDDLKEKHKEMVAYMSAIRYTLIGHTHLPAMQETRRMAEKLLQVVKEFKMESKDGYESSSSKVDNICDDFDKHDEWLTALGIKTLTQQLRTSCNSVRKLLEQRIQNEASRQKGLMKTVRQATDAAIQRTYDVIEAMLIMQPSEQITQIKDFLLSVENRAKQYYIGAGRGLSSEEGEVTPTSPTNESDAEAGAPGSISEATEGKDNNQNSPTDNSENSDE